MIALMPPKDGNLLALIGPGTREQAEHAGTSLNHLLISYLYITGLMFDHKFKEVVVFL